MFCLSLFSGFVFYFSFHATALSVAKTSTAQAMRHRRKWKFRMPCINPCKWSTLLCMVVMRRCLARETRRSQKKGSRRRQK